MVIDVMIRKGLRPGHYGSLGPKNPMTFESAVARASEMQHRDHIRMVVYQCKKCYYLNPNCSWHMGKRPMKYIRMPSEWDILEYGTRVTGCLNQENNSSQKKEAAIKSRVIAAHSERLGVLSRPRPIW